MAAAARSAAAAPPPAVSPLLSAAAPASMSSPLASSHLVSPSGPSLSRTQSGSYFPQVSSQLPSRQRPSVSADLEAAPSDKESVTISNTITNSQPSTYAPEAALSGPAPVRPTRFTEEWDASQRGSSVVDGVTPLNRGTSPAPGMQRSNSMSGSIAGESQVLSRSNTLKKKPSLRRSGSLKRSSSRRSMKAGSVRSLALQSNTDEDETHSAFFCPVPTSGNPTEVLANRFQAWRKILKDLIAYFREVQTHYEHRSKSLLKLSNVVNNTTPPQGFLSSGGLDDAQQLLRNYNKQAVLEANKAREIEDDVILALTGLRSDLQQKIKEIKNLSGDFKNSVDKEMEGTRRAVNALQGVLGQSELDPSLTTGKQDPYLLRLAVDRQLDKQIDEENYLHQAYLNLENSGRELESIVVGEIQKSYNAYAGILKREADVAYSVIEDLRVGPIAMPKDHEWASFVQTDSQFVSPDNPVRSTELIHYPGRDHYACQEVRAGLLERKSKYLKSYTAGWYVLSPTHLHEFKSADKTQAPVMSLYLPEQKLGSHSTQGGSSNKFILKGRQTGAMHRGHTWVFRAESHDTMMAWYEDIKSLTEKTPQERSDFVRGHSRSLSRSSQHSVSSDGVVDEEDDEPFAGDAAVNQQPSQEVLPKRPEPGGRFPSDIQVNAQRGLQAPLSPSSVSSGYNDLADRDVIAAAAALPGSSPMPHRVAGTPDPRLGYGSSTRTPMDEAPSHAAIVSQDAQADGVNPYTNEPIKRQDSSARFSQGATPMAGFTAPARTLSDSRGETATEAPANPAVGDGQVPRFPGEVREAMVVDQQATGTDARAVATPAYVDLSQKVSGTTAVPVRPSGATTRTDSVPTISHLHIPGEYPKPAPAH